MTPLRFLFVVGIPGAISLALFLIAWGWVKRDREDPSASLWGGALGFAGGLVFGAWQVLGRWPALRETDAGDWLPLRVRSGQEWIVYLAIFAGVVGVAQSFRRPPMWVRLAIHACVSLLLVLLVLQSKFASTWTSTADAVLWASGLSLFVFVCWTALDELAERSEGVGLPLSLWAVAAGVSGCLILARSAKLAEMAATLSAVCGGAWATALWRRDLRIARGAVPVFVVGLFVLLLQGRFYTSYLGWAPAILLGLSPACAWVDRLGPIRERSWWQRAIVQVAAVLVPIAIAALLIWLGLPAPEEDPYGSFR